MHDAIKTMLERYKCVTRNDYENALKEIIQEVALLGLWRQKFFEHAIFYGGTSLRILHKLQRFSEDLDFSLLGPNPKFDLAPYHKAMKDELEAFGFSVTVESKEKEKTSQIESAFIKAGTKIHFFHLNIPDDITAYIQGSSLLKVKFELDTDPPGSFDTEMKTLFQPTTFQVKTMTLSDLFASKLHALIARQWKTRVKGRDYYDMIWFVGKSATVHLAHLKSRLVQSGHWKKSDSLTRKDALALLASKLKVVDFEKAKKDVSPFLKQDEQGSLSLWNKEFFMELIQKIEAK
jgi:predicted nucleotidyltransferase component of viral defense system